MRMNQKNTQLQKLFCLILVIIGIVVVWRFSTSEGNSLKISSSIKKAVKENYLQYSKLSYIDFQNEKEVRDGFRQSIRRQNSDLLTDSLKTDLADFLAEVLLSKGAGDFDRYERCCKLRAHFIPSNEIVDFYRTWFSQDPPDIYDAYEMAKEMFILETRYDGGKHLFAGCSFDEKAIRMQCVRVEDVSVKIDTTKELSEDESRYWFGPIANGSYHFFVPEISIEDVVKKYGSVLWVDFQIVVKTRDEDMYPLRIRLWHHPDMNQWIIDAVTRQSTIRGATSSPSLVF